MLKLNRKKNVAVHFVLLQFHGEVLRHEPNLLNLLELVHHLSQRQAEFKKRKKNHILFE